MISFDDFGSLGEVEKVINNYTTISSFSTVNNYTTYSNFTTESYITNNYTTYSNFTTESYITNNYTTIEGTMPYMKLYNSSDGNYQYNLSGTISETNVPLSSDLCLCGNMEISELNLTNAYSTLNIKANGISNLKYLDTYSDLNGDLSGISLYSNTIAKAGNLNLNGMLFSSNSIRNGVVEAKGLVFLKDTYDKYELLNLSGDMVEDVNFLNGKIADINVLNMVGANSVKSCNSFNLNCVGFQPMTFSAVNTVNLHFLTYDSDPGSTLSFENIDDLHMNFYLPTSDNVNYINVNKYVFGNPERLFDASGSYTIPLNKSQVYLSEVPLTMLNIGAPVDWNYMKNFRISDGDFQYNISGFDDEGIISNTNSYLHVLGNAVASSKTFDSFKTLNLDLKEINNNSIIGNFCKCDAYKICNNSFGNVMNLNAKCSVYSGNYMTLSSAGVINVSAKDINNVSIDVYNYESFAQEAKSVSLIGDLMLSNITISNVRSVYLKGHQIYNVCVSSCGDVYLDIDSYNAITVTKCGSVYFDHYDSIYNDSFFIRDNAIVDLPSLNAVQFSYRFDNDKIHMLNLRSMDTDEIFQYRSQSEGTFSFHGLVIPRYSLSYNGIHRWMFNL